MCFAKDQRNDILLVVLPSHVVFQFVMVVTSCTQKLDTFRLFMSRLGASQYKTITLLQFFLRLEILDVTRHLLLKKIKRSLTYFFLVRAIEFKSILLKNNSFKKAQIL